MPRRVLILCTGNSCRSIMAEYLWRDLGRGRWECWSAGTDPAEAPHPLALEVLAEVGLPAGDATSKGIDRLAGLDFDLVVSVCDPARELCRTWPGARRHLHWPFDDPAEAVGSEDQRRAEFRRGRDEIRARIAAWLAEAGG